MSRFGAMKAQRAQAKSVPLADDAAASIETSAVAAKPAPRAAARQGKKAVSGYFSPEVSRALNMLAIENGTTLQALMGEAIDLLMRQHGKHPFGER